MDRMCANIGEIRSLIIDNLADLDRLLFDWERQCILLDDNKYHFLEIRSLVNRVKYHIERIKVEKTLGERNMRVEKKVEENLEKKQDKIGNNTRVSELVNRIQNGNDKKEEIEVTGYKNQVNRLEDSLIDKQRTIEESTNVKHQKTVAHKRQEVLKLTPVIVDIPADAIEKKVMQESPKVNFRNKEMRKAPSWKYLEKWTQILDEEWTEYTNNNYENDNNNNNSDNNNVNRDISPKNCGGVNIIKSKGTQLFNGSKKQKFNSTECIVDKIIDTKLESSHKRYVSEGDLLGDFDFIMNAMENGNFLDGPGYLLSLRDLQSFDRVDNLDNLSPDSDNESDNDSCAHKPRIVGVLYKDKL